METEISYPASDRFTLGFSAYEDRLLLSTNRPKTGPATLLLTRRMVVLIIKQLLAKLPDLSGLQQTPRSYWQEVLQMSHQKAVTGEPQTRTPDQPTGEVSGGATPKDELNREHPVETADLYLATELTAELRGKQLVLAFKGLPLPDAMRSACKHEPVVAYTLEPEKVHWLLELLIAKSAEAQWHLPLDLPWLAPLDSSASAKTTSH